MDNNRPIILVSNDDGITAPGLRHLIKCRYVKANPRIQRIVQISNYQFYHMFFPSMQYIFLTKNPLY